MFQHIYTLQYYEESVNNVANMNLEANCHFTEELYLLCSLSRFFFCSVLSIALLRETNKLPFIIQRLSFRREKMTHVATVTYPDRCSEMIRKLAGEKQNKKYLPKEKFR